MAHSAVLDSSAIPYERDESIPWYLWAGMIATTSAVVGGQWDISWHRSIGRDTFWTPAHMAIYLCGLIAGFGGGWVVLSTTFGRAADRAAASVRMWGFRAPLGIFMCIWGAIAMLTSAPFDDWWHNAYGLDVKILSPPHMVLALGMQTIQLGVLIMVLGEMNRATGARRQHLEWMYLYGASMMFSALLTVLMEITFRSNMHNSEFYRVTVAASLLALAGIARACGNRWSATIVTLFYTLFMIALIVILPRFHAEPKLGPVFHQSDFFMPPEFPMLLVVPALVLDLLIKKLENLNKWVLSAISAAAFLVAFVAVQWPFADFLMTPASRNWFFGTHYMPYYIPDFSYFARHEFFPAEPSGVFWTGMGTALVAAFLTTRLSLGWGDWMRKIQR